MHAIHSYEEKSFISPYIPKERNSRFYHVPRDIKWVISQYLPHSIFEVLRSATTIKKLVGHDYHPKDELSEGSRLLLQHSIKLDEFNLIQSKLAYFADSINYESFVTFDLDQMRLNKHSVKQIELVQIYIQNVFYKEFVAQTLMENIPIASNSQSFEIEDFSAPIMKSKPDFRGRVIVNIALKINDFYKILKIFLSDNEIGTTFYCFTRNRNSNSLSTTILSKYHACNIYYALFKNLLEHKSLSFSYLGPFRYHHIFNFEIKTIQIVNPQTKAPLSNNFHHMKYY